MFSKTQKYLSKFFQLSIYLLVLHSAKLSERVSVKWRFAPLPKLPGPHPNRKLSDIHNPD